MAEENEFDTWMEAFWWQYPNDLCDKKKGAKPKAKAAAAKIYKTGGIGELNRIKDNTAALIRHDKKEWDRGGKPYRWPMVSSYLNQGYYDREIESYAEKKVVAKNCQCGKKADIHDQCIKCYEKTTKPAYKREMYERLKGMGLGLREGESGHDYAMRCRDYARSKYPILRGME